MAETDQRDFFLESEADAYYKRNKEKYISGELISKDQVLAALEAFKLRPKSILEVGACNGWRLDVLRQRCNAKCFGIEPSTKAINDGNIYFPGVSLQKGTAEKIPFDDNYFDLVIIGFCLYVCDRKHLFKIAYEVERVLNEKGYIAIVDFHPPFPYWNPYRDQYEKRTYKMNYSDLFSWNPAYTLIFFKMFNQNDNEPLEDISDPNKRASVSILRKDTEIAYPQNPYKSKSE